MSESYTLDEARRELARRECERDGHSPANHLFTVGDRRGWWMCECGETTWKAVGSETGV